MLPRFRIRQLKSSENPSGPDLGDDFLSSPLPQDDDVVEIASIEYTNLLNEFPEAALTYVDADDGELITVGSSFELIQRLKEPVPASAPLPAVSPPVFMPSKPRLATPHLSTVSPPMHTFDINRSRLSIFLWRDIQKASRYSNKHAPSTSNGGSLTAKSPPSSVYKSNTLATLHADEDFEFSRKLELEDHRKRHFNASNAPKASPWHLDPRFVAGIYDKTATAKEALDSSEPEDDEHSRETTPLLKSTSPQSPSTEDKQVNLTVEGTRQAQKAGARIRSNLFPNFPETPRTTTAEKAAHADRWASYARGKPGLPSAVSPLSSSHSLESAIGMDEVPKPFLELFKDELQKMNLTSADTTISLPEGALPAEQNELPPQHQLPNPTDILSQTISSLSQGLGALSTEIRDTLPEMQAHLSNAQQGGPLAIAKGLIDALSGLGTQVQQIVKEATREASRATRDADQEAFNSVVRGIQHLTDGMGNIASQISMPSNNAPTSTSPSATGSHLEDLEATLPQQPNEPKPTISSSPLNNFNDNTVKSCESIPEVVSSSLFSPLPPNDFTATSARHPEERQTMIISSENLCKRTPHNHPSCNTSSEPAMRAENPKSDDSVSTALEILDGESIPFRAFENPHYERIARKCKLPVQSQPNAKDNLAAESIYAACRTSVDDNEIMQKEHLPSRNAKEGSSGSNSDNLFTSVRARQASSLRHNRNFLRGDIPYQRQAEYSRGRTYPRRTPSSPTYEYLIPVASDPNVESAHLEHRFSRRLHSEVPKQRHSRSRSPPALHRLSRSPPSIPPGWGRYPRHGPIHLPHDPPQMPRHPYRHPGPPQAPPSPPPLPAIYPSPLRPYPRLDSAGDAPRSPTLRHRRSWHPGFQRSQLEPRGLKPTVSFAEPTSARSHRHPLSWESSRDIRPTRSFAGPLREEFKYSPTDTSPSSRFHFPQAPSQDSTVDLLNNYKDQKSNSIDPALQPLTAQPMAALSEREHTQKKQSWPEKDLELSGEHGASAVNSRQNTSAPNSPPSPLTSCLRRAKTMTTPQNSHIQDSSSSNPFLSSRISPLSSASGTPHTASFAHYFKPLPPQPTSYPPLQPSSPLPSILMEAQPTRRASEDWLGQQLSNSQHPEMDKFPSLSEFEGLAFQTSFPALPSMDTLTPERLGSLPATIPIPQNPFSTPPSPALKQAIPADTSVEKPSLMAIPGSWPSIEKTSDSEIPSNASGKEHSMTSAAHNARLAGPFDPLAESVTLHRSRILEGVRRCASDYRPHGDHYASDRRHFTRQLGRWNSQIEHSRGAVNHSLRTPIRANERLSTHSANRNPPPSVTPSADQLAPPPATQKVSLPEAHSDASTVVKVQECVELLKSLGYGMSEDGGVERLVLYSQAADGDLETAMEIIEEERRAWSQRG
ncbi:MAG: hypothetical protein M1829_002005 [Trizodia sp. TS-e1964]|nr:MAG: hypothetical protein M1829_002005 [Trizodia sp. TS-e1964]